MNKAAILGAVSSLAIAAAAQAQVIVQSNNPPPAVIVQPAQPTVVVQQPQPGVVVQQTPVVVSQPVVIGPAPLNQVVVAQPTTVARVYVPQAVVNTTIALTAPFNPAPPNSSIETTAGRRVVRAIDGWDVVFDDNGTTHRSHALLTDGLDEQNSFIIRSTAESMWPLTVGTSHTGHAETSTAHAVTFSVLRTETITVPAGTFYTYVVERQEHSPTDGTNSFRTMWYAPSIGAMVKAEDRRASGSTAPSYQLVSMSLPAAVATATVVAVTRRADTPETRMAYCSERGTTLQLADGRTLVMDCTGYIHADRVAYDNWLIVH